ncbi:calcium-binding protein [Saprospira sp. CCB-QB6]|uniref:EF-hand domain-containing protein n=1 Tax=Saprospira sp. CCB-QB6 TaxID=3023936 RepID=UPI0023493A6E|nr:EF-hand domain-containing protein [Saprospira sp. CCB-QB6]WCL81222.1 calcium-binding protein [Saprospira sp. CCB-QB6]
MKNLLMFIGFGLIALNCNAQDQKRERPAKGDMFEQMDANQDGQISEAEAKGPLKENFATIDSNNDGFISQEELKNAPKPERKKGGKGQKGEAGKGNMFEKMDADQDGQISEAEAKGPLKENFATIDSNNDGFISEEEMKNAPKPERGQGRQRKAN